MSVRIRLTRMGRRNRPFYRVVIADSRARRDGRFIEQIGTYDPIKENKNFSVKEERVFHWLRSGAKPSDTVKRLLAKEGIMLKWHLENSNISEDKKKQEIQKWEMAKAGKEKAKAEKKAAKKVEEEVEEAPVEEPAEAPVEEKAAEEKVESASTEATAEVPEVEAVEKVEEKPAEDVKEEAVEETKESAAAEAPADKEEAKEETPEDKPAE